MSETTNRIIYRTSVTPYSPTHQDVINKFLQDPTIYYTPMTMYLSMNTKCACDTIKNCMQLLLKNSYLTKEGGSGTNYYCITKENIEFWVTDFRRHVLELEESKKKPITFLENNEL